MKLTKKQLEYIIITLAQFHLKTAYRIEFDEVDDILFGFEVLDKNGSAIVVKMPSFKK